MVPGGLRRVFFALIKVSREGPLSLLGERRLFVLRVDVGVGLTSVP